MDEQFIKGASGQIGLIYYQSLETVSASYALVASVSKRNSLMVIIGMFNGYPNQYYFLR